MHDSLCFVSHSLTRYQRLSVYVIQLLFRVGFQFLVFPKICASTFTWDTKNIFFQYHRSNILGHEDFLCVVCSSKTSSSSSSMKSHRSSKQLCLDIKFNFILNHRTMKRHECSGCLQKTRHITVAAAPTIELKETFVSQKLNQKKKASKREGNNKNP